MDDDKKNWDCSQVTSIKPPLWTVLQLQSHLLPLFLNVGRHKRMNLQKTEKKMKK